MWLSAKQCDSDDYFQLPFAAVDTHRQRSWTMTFSESAALATLPQAERAGLKRLLLDLGYKIRAIDAKPDKATDAALADFRKRLRMAPTATADDLFDALETEAMKTATPAGFSVCNDTEKSVAAAAGRKTGAYWASHGWWKIAAGSCAQLFADLKGVDAVYLLVQRSTGRPWQAGRKNSASPISSSISPAVQTAPRAGTHEAGFAEIRVKGLPGYAAHVGDGGLLKPMQRHITTSK